MNLTNNTLMIVMVPTIFALFATAFAGPLPDIAVAQIINGTPGEVGTKNNSEAYYSPLNLTGPETIEEFESIEGSNADIFSNDTNISNPNITAAESDEINIQEDCMQLPNQSSVDCP
ncbi:MAG: hypothetical protein L0H55_07965 [Candidatus Nitrosocosmicus sp.]|nr:hypothetical protein [Candidatus Nitrosocosmicus sp.]